MTFRLRFPALLTGLSTAARAYHSSFWGTGATSVRTTPWHIDTFRGAGRAGQGPAR